MSLKEPVLNLHNCEVRFKSKKEMIIEYGEDRQQKKRVKAKKLTVIEVCEELNQVKIDYSPTVLVVSFSDNLHLREFVDGLTEKFQFKTMTPAELETLYTEEYPYDNPLNMRRLFGLAHKRMPTLMVSERAEQYTVKLALLNRLSRNSSALTRKMMRHYQSMNEDTEMDIQNIGDEIVETVIEDAAADSSGMPTNQLSMMTIDEDESQPQQQEPEQSSPIKSKRKGLFPMISSIIDSFYPKHRVRKTKHYKVNSKKSKQKSRNKSVQCFSI